MGEKPTAVDAEEAERAAKERDDKQQAGITIGEEGVQRAVREREAEQARHEGSMPAIQNIRAREAAPPGGGAAPLEGDPIPDIGGASPAAATNLNSSRSNVARTTGPSGGAPEPTEATNLNSSKSNVAREAGPPEDASDEDAQPPRG